MCKYDIIYLKEQDEHMKENDLKGYCDRANKMIYVWDQHNESWVKDTLAHELIHAYLYEIGYDKLDNETDVEILSKLLRKLGGYVI
jgi:Zn-dependent peptidase ImmA (M78 family)